MWLMKCNGNRGRFVIGWIKCMSRQCKVSLIVSVSLIGWTEEVDRFFQREAASVENIIKKGSDLMTCRITTTGNLINSTAFVNMYPFICPIHFFQKGLETPVSFQISAAVFWASLWLAVVFWVSLWFAVVFWASLWLAAVFWALRSFSEFNGCPAEAWRAWLILIAEMQTGISFNDANVM